MSNLTVPAAVRESEAYSEQFSIQKIHACLPHQLASPSHVLTECHGDQRFETESYGVILLMKTANIRIPHEI